MKLWEVETPYAPIIYVVSYLWEYICFLGIICALRWSEDFLSVTSDVQFGIYVEESDGLYPEVYLSLCWEIIITNYMNFDRVPVSPVDWATQTFICFEFRSIGGRQIPPHSRIFPWFFDYRNFDRLSISPIIFNWLDRCLVWLEDRELFRLCIHSHISNLYGYELVCLF